MSSVAPDYLREVAKRAQDMCMQRILSLVDRMVVDGLAYGDEPLSDAEFVPMYLDLRTRGVLDYLPTVNPQLAERMRRHFERIMVRGLE